MINVFAVFVKFIIDDCFRKVKREISDETQGVVGCHSTGAVDFPDIAALACRAILGGQIVGEVVARELIEAFLHASFSGSEEFVRRVNKLEYMNQL